MSKPQKNVGRVSTRQATSAHGDVGLREEAANPTYGDLDMAGDYPITRVGDLAVSVSETHKFGKEHLIFLNTSDILHGKFLHRTYSAVKDWPGQAKKSIRKDDILFSEIRPANGRWAFVEEDADDYVVSTKLMVIRARKERVSPKFLYQYLTSKEISSWLQHLAESRSGTFPQITFDEVASLELPLPPLPEQKAIAHILGTLDDKIELNRRMNATLEAMARALFQSWFVDFDPVRAKLDGRKPAGLDADTAALFPAHFQESTLGHIPQGWEVTKLGTCIGFRSGFSFKSQDWQESGVPVVKIGSVKPGIIDLSQVSYVSDEIAQQAARYRLSVGDMLIGMTGYVGEVGLVPPTDNLPLLNQRVGKFVLPKPDTESLPFWYCTTRQSEFRAFVEARSHGTAQANVSGEAIMEFPLVSPPSGILDTFNRACRPLFDCILTNHAESRILATLRDTLLPKLLSGELSVSSSAAICV